MTSLSSRGRLRKVILDRLGGGDGLILDCMLGFRGFDRNIAVFNFLTIFSFPES